MLSKRKSSGIMLRKTRSEIKGKGFIDFKTKAGDLRGSVLVAQFHAPSRVVHILFRGCQYSEITVSLHGDQELHIEMIY